jgi:hypothetical protein
LKRKTGITPRTRRAQIGRGGASLAFAAQRRARPPRRGAARINTCDGNTDSPHSRQCARGASSAECWALRFHTCENIRGKSQAEEAGGARGQLLFCAVWIVDRRLGVGWNFKRRRLWFVMRCAQLGHQRRSVIVSYRPHSSRRQHIDPPERISARSANERCDTRGYLPPP